MAQAEETSDRELSLTEVRSLRHQVESSSAPEEGQQKQLLELYDQAMADLESANQAQMQVRRELLSLGVEKHQAAFSSGTWLTGTPLTYLAPW